MERFGRLGEEAPDSGHAFLSALFSIASLIIAALAYLAPHAAGMSGGASFVAILIAILPAILIIVPFVFQNRSFHVENENPPEQRVGEQ
jgi:hypothetical protein